MENSIFDLQNKFSEELGRAAHEYLEVGLDLFHKYRSSESECGQAAVGNMAIAVELMLKSFIGVKNLGNIFKDIPPEMRVFLSNPENIPRFFKWRNYNIDIRSDKYKMLDLDESIASFYIFSPQLKQLLQPHINVLSRWRNASLHGILPALNTYEFEKIGLAVLTIVTSLITDETFHYSWYTLTENDTCFLQDFEAKRKERVTIALEQAKHKSPETIPGNLEVVIAHNWETFTTGCPVCKSSSLLEGYTELAIGEDEDGPYPSLDFFATTFHCEECGLTLYDIEELRLANMNTIYDRSDELDKWFREHVDFSDLYLDKNT